MLFKNKTLEQYFRTVDLLDYVSSKVEPNTDEISCLCWIFNKLLKTYKYDEVSLKKPVVYNDNKVLFMHGKPRKKDYSGLGLAYKDDKYYLAGILGDSLLLGEANVKKCTGKELLTDLILTKTEIETLFNKYRAEALKILGDKASIKELSNHAMQMLFIDETFLEYYTDMCKANPELGSINEPHLFNQIKSVHTQIDSWESKLERVNFDKKAKTVLSMLCYFLPLN